jgi:hypothetical protein
VETPAPVAPVAPVAPEVPAATPPAPNVSVPVAPVPTPAAPRLLDVNVAGALKGAKGKLRVSFKLTQSATVRFTVTAKGKAVATWTRKAHRGGNRYTLKRKLPTGRTLKRGSYRLSVGLSASAKASSAAIRVR